MDLHRIATRVARTFTAEEVQALDGFHDIMKVLTSIRNHGSDVIELIGHADLSGPALEEVNAMLSGFTVEFAPKAAEMDAKAEVLTRQVGDSVVKHRRTRTRG